MEEKIIFKRINEIIKVLNKFRNEGKDVNKIVNLQRIYCDDLSPSQKHRLLSWDFKNRNNSYVENFIRQDIMNYQFYKGDFLESLASFIERDNLVKDLKYLTLYSLWKKDETSYRLFELKESLKKVDNRIKEENDNHQTFKEFLDTKKVKLDNKDLAFENELVIKDANNQTLSKEATLKIMDEYIDNLGDYLLHSKNYDLLKELKNEITNNLHKNIKTLRVKEDVFRGR